MTSTPDDPSGNSSPRNGYVGPDYAVIPAGDVALLQDAVDVSTQDVWQPYAIYLAAGEYLLTETLVIYGTVTLYGAGMDVTVLRQVGLPGSQSGSMNTLINVPGKSLVLDNLTLTDGATNYKGGAIYVESPTTHLTVSNAKFLNNHADDPTWGYGGAIFSIGTVTLNNVYFEGNTATIGGAIAVDFSYSAQLAVDAKRVEFKANIASSSKGGAIYSAQGNVKVRNSNFRQNSSASSGALRKHVYSENTAVVAIDAKMNYWNGPSVPSSSNANGVDSTQQKPDKVSITLDPYTPPPAVCLPGTLRCDPPLTPTPTPSATPSTASLADYGIVIEGNYDSAQQAAILAAVIQTGNALSDHGAALTSVEAFREVMQGEVGGVFRTIKFSRVELSQPVCITAKTPDNPDYSANIQCHTTVIITEHAAVHELGHVLVGRTTVNGTSSYLSRIRDPDGSGTANRILTDRGNFLMGVTGYNLQGNVAVLDWQRSDVDTDNGWGTAALWEGSYYGPYALLSGGQRYIPKLGPCGEGAPTPQPPVVAQPFTFQQNPCTFPNWILPVGSIGTVVEIEEAAADMFLNWVYDAFQNRLWRLPGCYPDGCAQQQDNAGEKRKNFMDLVMWNLFTDFGW
jgi:predicted outer membrane repeat protein